MKRHVAQQKHWERERVNRLAHQPTSWSQCTTRCYSSIEPNILLQPDPLARCPYFEPINELSFEEMNVLCSLCHAFHWLAEHVKHSPTSAPQFSSCCHHGKVSLHELPKPPQWLQNLFTLQRFRNVKNCKLCYMSFKPINTNGIPLNYSLTCTPMQSTGHH